MKHITHKAIMQLAVILEKSISVAEAKRTLDDFLGKLNPPK